MPCFSWLFVIVVWLIFYSVVTVVVVAQVSKENPLIWQSLVSSTLSNARSPVPNSAVKYYSQDFQTVSAYKDVYGYNERILINVGDGCFPPTYEDIANMNSANNGITTFIRRQPLIGLVSRGGCSWSTKINNLQDFVLKNTILGIKALLIYDNITYANNVTQVLLGNPRSVATPIWRSTELSPIQRNISSMEDNDIGNMKMTTFAVYFVPRQFGLEMLAKMNGNSDQSIPRNATGSGGNNQYVLLAPYFSDMALDDNPPGTDSNNNGGYDGNDGLFSGGTDNLFGNRGYIAYLVAAGVAIIMAVVLFRWCRKPRFGSRRNRSIAEIDLENQVRMQQFQQFQQTDEPPRIPIEKLDIICPIQPAGKVMPSMKNSVCAICLDDFKEISEIRFLPCHHGFCVGCIDVWLTKKSSWCPICKYDCYQDLEWTENAGDLGKMPITTTYKNSTTSVRQCSPVSSEASSSSITSPLSQPMTNISGSTVTNTTSSQLSSTPLQSVVEEEEDLGNSNTFSHSTASTLPPPPYVSTQTDTHPATTSSSPGRAHRSSD